MLRSFIRREFPGLTKGQALRWFLLFPAASAFSAWVAVAVTFTL